MTTYVIRRLLQAVPLLLLISIIAFFIIQLTGDPLAAFTVDSSLGSADLARLRHQYGLDQPLPLQYINWLKNMLKGDWGSSYYARQPVTRMVFETLPNTLILVVMSYSMCLLVSIILGILTAVKQYSLVDHLVTALSFVGIAMPSFWMALMLIVLFSVRTKAAGLPYFPVGGMYDAREAPSLAQLLWHAVLPSFTLTFVMAARYIRYIRSTMLEQIRLDYVRTARSKGLAENTVLYRHVFKNALLPLITLVGLDIPSLLSGAIVIESIFAWPGMGRLFWASAQRTDTPVLMAMMLFVAVLTVFCSLLADIVYAAVDPRIKFS